MALKSYKPTTPSQRNLVIVDRTGLYRGKPVKSLVEGQNSTGGRNNHGRITSRFRGGGHKQAYRTIDFKRVRREEAATVERIKGLVHRAGTPVRDVCTLDFSRRSAEANAAVIGLGRSRRVVPPGLAVAPRSGDVVPR